MFLLLGKTLLKHRPVALFVVVGGIVAARVMHLDERGVALLGAVPQGLPMPTLPMVSWADVHEIVPLAMACFMLAAVETTAIGRMFAAKHGYRLDATQEFLAIGSANLAAGLGSGFPVSGGMSQSLVNETAGARTPLSGLVAALIMLVVVVFFTGLLRTLPQPVLAAVVLMAVTGLIQVEALRNIWRFSRAEFAVAMAALLGVLARGIAPGRSHRRGHFDSPAHPPCRASARRGGGAGSGDIAISRTSRAIPRTSASRTCSSSGPRARSCTSTSITCVMRCRRS